MGRTSKKAEIIITAKDRASGSLHKVRESSEAVASSFKAIALAGAAAAAAFTAIAVKAVKASVEQETGIRRLDAALQRVGDSYSDASAEIEAFASAQQATTRYGDETTRQVLQQLVQLTGDYSAATLRATALIEDMAESGMSLDGATRAVGMALAGNVQALGRYVPELRGLSQAQVDAMTSAERQRLVLDALAAQYGGTAAAIAPLDLAMARVANKAGDVEQAFGDALKASGALESGGGAIIDSLSDFERWVQANGQGISRGFLAMLGPPLEALGLMAQSVAGIVEILQTLPALASSVEVSLQGAALLWTRITGSQEEYLDAQDRARRSIRDMTSEWGRSADAVLATDEALEQFHAL